jgi:hypothetical protein
MNGRGGSIPPHGIARMGEYLVLAKPGGLWFSS